MVRPTRFHSNAIIYFNAVRRAKSIREAARQLNVASSAVNRQILKLEEEVGLPLFDRLASGVRLTAAGVAFARHATAVLQDCELLVHELGQIARAETGHLSIAAADGICTSIIPDVLTKLLRDVPGATYSVRRLGSLEIAEAVLEGEADIGIAFDLVLRPGIDVVASADYELGAVLHAAHPLAGEAKVSLRDCLDYPVILAERSLSLGQLLEPAFVRMKVSPAAVIRTNSIDLIRQMVCRGSGIAFQTRFGLDDALLSGEAVYVPLDADGPVVSSVVVVQRSGRSLLPLHKLFISLVAAQLERYRNSGRQPDA